MLKKFRKKTTRKKIFITIGIAIIAVVMAIAGILSKREITKENTFTPDSELARAMTYDQFKDSDADISGTDYVKFGAFFLRDVNNDGYAEKIKGTCKKIGAEDTLYMELNVLTNGYLEDGVITINSDNFYLQTAIPKDNEVKENAFSNNTKQISLNKINNGSQKLLTGIIRSGDYTYESKKYEAIGDNTSKYSKVNSITLTGTHVADDGTKTKISKTIKLNMDWYGSVKSEMPDNIAGSQNLNQSRENTNIVDENNNRAILEFNIGTQEVNNELILSKVCVEGTLPQLNGYNPSKVEVKNQNASINYDEETRNFTIKKSAELNSDNIVNTQCYDGMYGNTRYNKFNLKVTYPLEAYVATGGDAVEIKIPVTSYYEGYNNNNYEFKDFHKSNVSSGTIVVTYSRPSGDYARFDLTVGKYMGYPKYTYVISKKNPLKIYNEISAEENNDTYITKWSAVTGRNGDTEGLVMKETETGKNQVSDEFIKADSSTESMENVTSNVGIYFSNPVNLLGKDGSIKVYDDETGELLHEFTKSDWNNYSESSPYKYEVPVKHIRVETSATLPNYSMSVYNVKKLDDAYITTNYTREEFDNLKYIKSTLSGYVGENHVNTDTHTAHYEEQYSMADIKLSKTAISTQETEKNMQITISILGEENLNQKKWKNGIFLVKLPKDLIDIDISSVVSNNSAVDISSFETLEKDGNKFIKIITSNENPFLYAITINCDMTADPRILTNTESFELYAYNEDEADYYNPVEDIYDINGNENTKEKVNKSSINISFVSPNSFLTNESATDFDENESVAVAPQIAVLDKERKNATVNIEINNNYSSNVNEVKILGRVPFEGNKYAINGEDMGSTFTATMTNEGINLPDKLKSVAKIYYSENGEATKDLDDSNGWTETPSDFSKVKSYLIDFGDYKFAKDEKYKISYNIEIPENLEYNKIAYSHHAIYFSLNTAEGKYKTQVEPNKIGFMITKQFELELTKYQKDKDIKVKGATYAIIEDGQGSSKTRGTDKDGKFTMSGLYVNKTYTVREVKSPNEYELNDEIVKFTTSENDGVLSVIINEGNARAIRAIQPTENDGYKVQLELEDELRGKLQITKFEKNTENKIPGVKYKLTGNNKEAILTTNTDGQTSISSLKIGEEYTLEEIKADGYYLSENPVKFKISNTDGAYSAKVTEGTTKKSEFVEEEWPTLKLELEDEKKPLYNLEISKIQKVTTSEATEDEKVSADEILSSTETVYLSGAKFKLFKGTQELGNYVTDDNGKITIRNLYQYIDGKNEEAVYTLKEMLPPVGYVKAKDISFKVDGSTGELVFINTDGVDEKYTTDGNTVKLLIEDNQVFKLVKRDAETQELLANIKFAIYNIDNGSTPAKNSKGEILGTKEVIDGKEYYTITTNEKGELTADLPEGMYKALEVEAPEKYDISKAYYFGIGTATEPSAYAQSVWGRSLGTDSGSEIKDVINTSDNGFIAVGNYSSQKEIDLGNNQSLPVSEGYDAMMIKYNLDSVVEWTKVISGTNSESIEKIFETSDGGYIAGGYFQSTANFENGITLTSNGSKDALIVKYTSEGNVEWAKSFGGTAEDSISAVSETSDGGYIVGGYFKSSSVDLESGVTLKNKNTDQTEDGIIVKYNNKGTIEWAHVIGGTKDDEVQSVAVTLEGNIIVGGYFSSMNVELEDGFTMTNPITNATSLKNSMLIKYSNDGKIGWTKIIPATDNYDSNSINSIIRSKNGGFVIGGGSSSSPTKMGNGIVIENSSNGYRGIFAKYNDDGECEWANECGLNEAAGAYSIVETTDDGYLIGGYFNTYGGLDFGNGVSIVSNNYCDGMIVKYNSSGECEWARAIGGLDFDFAYSAIELSNGRYLAAGTFKKHTIYMENGVQLTYGAQNAEGFIVEFEKNETSSNVLTYGGKVIGGNKDDRITKMVSTSDGGYLVGGYFCSNIDLGNNIILKNSGNRQCGMIIKYNSNDEAEWAKVIGDYNTQVNTLVQLSDNSYIIGAVSSSYRFDLGDGVRVDTENNNKKGIVIKYDSNGRCEWAKTISGNGNNDVSTIAETTDGEIVVGGTFQYVITFENGTQLKNNCDRSYDSNVFLVKYTRDGKEEWVKQVSSTSDLDLYAMDATNDGGIIFTGRFYGKEVKFGNGVTATSNRFGPGMIAKFNSEGDAEWAKDVSPDLGTFINAVLSTSDGGYIVGGSFQANDTFDLGNGIILPCRGNSDFILIKYTAEGEIEWAKCAGGQSSDRICSILEMSDGYIVGGLMGSIGINLTEGKSLLREKTAMNGGIIKYDLDGNCQWAKSVSPDVQSIIQLSNGDIMAGGYISWNNKAYTDRDEIDTDDSYNGMIIKLTSFDGLNDVEELKVENERKEFKIRTSVKNVLGTKGGSISGENEKVYETIKYGDSATKEIKIIPNENYEIIGITINNEEYKFTKNEDGSYVMPIFTNVTEDKNIVVTFALKDNKITINKVDKDTKEKLSGAKFKIESMDDSSTYSSTFETNADGQIITQLSFGKYNITEIKAPDGYILDSTTKAINFSSDDATAHEITIKNEKKAQVIVHHYKKGTTEKIADDEALEGKVGDEYTTNAKLDIAKYELEKDENNEIILPTNAHGLYERDPIEVTYYYIERKIPLTIHHYIEGTTTGVPLKNGGKAEDIIESGNEGDSYVTSPIDETELDARYELVEMPINANGTYTGNEVIVTYYYKKFSKEISLVKQNEEGEKLQGVKFEIKNTEKKDESGIKLDELQNNGEYYFENRAGKLVSNNKGIPDSTASSYLKIDLRNAKKNVKLSVNYQISSDWSDYGYIALTSSSDTPSKNDSSRKLTVTCGSNSATNATADLPMGSVYYLHFAYQKDNAKDSYDDNFIINEITLDGNDYAKYLKNIQITDNEGKIENTLEAGTYEITELETLDEYQLPENPTFELNITKDTSEDAINIINEKKKGKVTVHHYLKDSTKSITLDDGSVAEDEIKIGNIGDRYASRPKDLASAYTLVNNPENSYGTYTEENIEITYYYEPKNVNVNINKIDDEGKAVKGAEFKLTNKMPEQNAVIDNGPGYPIVGEIGDKAGIKEELLTMAQYYQEKNQYLWQEFAPMEEKDGEYKTTKIIDSNNSVMMSAGVFKYDLTNYTETFVLNMTIEYKNGGNSIYLIKPDKQQTIDSVGYYVGTKDYSLELEGGKKYYIQCMHTHLGDNDEDQYIKVKNIDLYRYKQKYYGFEKNDNEEYVSNNSEVPNTVAQSYMPIDMTNYYGKFNLNVDFSIINSNDANQGAVKLYDDKNNVISTMSEVSGNVDSEKCTAILAGGNNYKLEFAYQKNDESTDTKDVMRINNIQIDPNVDLTGETDENGNLQFEVVPGEYELSETKVPDGYDPPENIKQNVTVTADGADVTVVNHKHKGTITVHHYIEGTTTPISLKNGENAQDDVIEGYVGNQYSAETIKETDTVYRVSNNPDNAKGEFIDGNIEITYYYVLMDSKVIVHYYEENTTNKVSEDVEITGKIYDKYTTKSAEDVLSKYELVEEPQNKSGVMAEDTIEVIYYYRVKDAVINVRYLEKGTNIELADADRIDGKVDENYETTAKNIEGYQLVEHTGNEKGKFEIEPITVTYYYLYKAKATVQYIDKITGQIIEQSTKEGFIGDEFVTESKNFENYVLVEEPSEKTVKLTREEQVLKYYYIHVSGGVIEKHIDVISGQILSNTVHEGNEGDEYDIPSRTFDGYDLVEDKLPANSKGTMKVEPIEVIYYYAYKTKVTAEYINKVTGEKMAEDEVLNGHEGDKYETERKNIDDYKLIEIPENADGTMTKEEIKVTYYYSHISGGVIINHIDIKTGKQLLDETKVEGYEGAPYETHEENISGYELVKEKYPENAKGNMTIEPIRVTYYYIKRIEVNVKYVDKETGEEIEKAIKISGHEGDDYKTEAKDIQGYNLVKEPENKDGTMKDDSIDVIYYYRRKTKVIVNYYDADTKEKLTDEIEITGHQNDEYTTEQKDFKFYALKEVPANKDGKMNVKVTKDENGKEIVENITYVNYYYRKLTFNLRVDKTIASVIVNGQETAINGSLGKVEIHRKELSTANVKVVYRIRVTNDSELSGKANVVDNIPSGMTMIADNNPGWTIKQTTASIETDEIKPGESREYQVVLGWQNGDGNIGTKENIASIITENEAGFEEKDKLDNESKADLIVAVGTGEVPYVAIAGGVLMIMIAITAGVYVIKKKRQ